MPVGIAMLLALVIGTLLGAVSGLLVTKGRLQPFITTLVTMTVYKQLRKMGKKIPEEIQLIGFDDVNFGQVFTPELTTIHQPIREMGTVAAQIVERCVEDQSYEKRNVFDVKLIQRETTK